MRFLADESCDFAVVRALRAAGHGVVAVSEVSPRAEDIQVIGMAVEEGRILLTEDKDFGQLVYAHAQRSGGVVLIRYPSSARRRLGSHQTVGRPAGRPVRRAQAWARAHCAQTWSLNGWIPELDATTQQTPIMKAFVAVRDRDWFEFLRRRPDLDEVSVWQPKAER